MGLIYCALIGALFLLLIGLTAGCSAGTAKLVMSAVSLIGAVVEILLLSYFLYSFVLRWRVSE
jgi:hypothetical protein